MLIEFVLFISLSGGMNGISPKTYPTMQECQEAIKIMKEDSWGVGARCLAVPTSPQKSPGSVK